MSNKSRQSKHQDRLTNLNKRVSDLEKIMHAILQGAMNANKSKTNPNNPEQVQIQSTDTGTNEGDSQLREPSVLPAESSGVNTDNNERNCGSKS